VASVEIVACRSLTNVVYRAVRLPLCPLTFP